MFSVNILGNIFYAFELNVCFIPFFAFSFVDEVTKLLRNLCLHFERQDGQDGKNRKETHATKVTKILKTKRRKCGMNETQGIKKWKTQVI